MSLAEMEVPVKMDLTNTYVNAGLVMKDASVNEKWMNVNRIPANMEAHAIDTLILIPVRAQRDLRAETVRKI